MTQVAEQKGKARIFGLAAAAMISISTVIITAQAQAAMPQYSREQVRLIVIQEAQKVPEVPTSLALAVAKTESDFQADVVSSAGARGVMQIMPATAKGEFGLKDPDHLFNPRLNARMGVQYLKRLNQQYGGKWELALSHYNGGTLKGGKGGDAKPHNYTKDYVATVFKHQRAFMRTATQTMLADASSDYKVQKASFDASQDPHADFYKMMDDPTVEKDWRHYLDVADRALNPSDPTPVENIYEQAYAPAEELPLFEEAPVQERFFDGTGGDTVTEQVAEEGAWQSLDGDAAGPAVREGSFADRYAKRLENRRQSFRERLEAVEHATSRRFM